MSDEEANEIDQELVELRELKKKLVHKAFDLKKEFEKWENMRGETYGRTEKDLIPNNQLHDSFNYQEEVVNRVSKKCIAACSFMLGVKFNNVDKKWISDNKYVYTANVKTEVLEFFMEVTVDREDAARNVDVLGIDCHFVNLRKCYYLEISPWVKRFTDDNDTSNLFRAVSNYTEENTIRTEILRKCQNKNITYAEECTEDDGGVTVFLHAKDKPAFVYFQIRWVLRFVESMWRVNNFFIIQPVSAEEDFLTDNHQLLQGFCKRNIAKTRLEQLWDELCTAIERDSASESPARTTGA